MYHSIVKTLGDWNPQLLRELKGRWKFHNVAIAVSLSILSQFFLIFIASSSLINQESSENYYCRIDEKYKCMTDSFGNLVIDWQHWWTDIFITMSFTGIIALLVVGTYVLIDDIAKEKNRGTLNFIRMSPQFSQSIIVGKLLGVPSLIYLAAALALPLYSWAGISAQIHATTLLGFDAVVVASCMVIYTAAIFFSLATNWLKGFQAWLGSGLILFFIIFNLFPMNFEFRLSHGFHNNSFDLIKLFFAYNFIPYFFIGNKFVYSPYREDIVSINEWKMKFFHLTISENEQIFLGFALLHCLVGTYIIFQALKRRLPNPNATLVTKRQSYLIAALCAIMIMGFTNVTIFQDLHKWIMAYAHTPLLFLNELILLALAASLIPSRQSLQDWSRYLQAKGENNPLQNSNFLGRSRGLWQDLVWGERSPALVAIALNIGITSAVIVPFFFLFGDSFNTQIRVAVAWIIYDLWILIYTAILQLILISKTPTRSIWAFGSTIGLWTLTAIIFAIFSPDPSTYPLIWLLSPFPMTSILNASITDMAIALLSAATLLSFLVWQYVEDVKKLGKSDTQTIFKKTSN